MAFFNTAASTSTTAASADKDIEVANPPNDSISGLAWSPQANYLSVSSWDNSVRIYEIGPSGESQGKAMFEHQGPALSVCWNKEGNKVFSGGADNAGRMFDVSTGQATQVAQHDAPIKVVKWVDSPQAQVLATGSWDKTIKYWDLRTPAPVATVQLPERCYTMDIQYPLMVVGTAERHMQVGSLDGFAQFIQCSLQIFNLSNPTTPYKAGHPLAASHNLDHPRHSYRLSNGKRASLAALPRPQQPAASQSGVWRVVWPSNGGIVYAINDISFHPVHGTFSTAGADDARNRLKSFDAAPAPITATAFSRDGAIFAYSIGYDWSKGHGGMTPGHINKLMLHACKDEEVKKRPRKT
ncbi:Poly + rna export protein [Mycena kentingensis (nom. inval.)]|nr:Poly + rna export protein [Mycena kentingensis (nom. inval.)]